MPRAFTLQDANRPFIKRVTGPLFFAFALFYLSFHALSGERSLLSLFTEWHRLEAIKAELASVKAQRETMEHKVRALSINSLDLDMLDEQVKRELGMAGRGEVVYFESDVSSRTK